MYNKNNKINIINLFIIMCFIVFTIPFFPNDIQLFMYVASIFIVIHGSSLTTKII